MPPQRETRPGQAPRRPDLVTPNPDTKERTWADGGLTRRGAIVRLARNASARPPLVADASPVRRPSPEIRKASVTLRPARIGTAAS